MVATRPVIILADALELARQCLLAGLDARWNGRVYVADPFDTDTPWVRLTRVGGGQLDSPVPGAEAPMFDVQCFGPMGSGGARTVHDLAREAQAVLLASLGFTAGEGTVLAASVNTGIAWEPDDSRDPPWARWVQTVSLVVVTTAAASRGAA